MSEIEQELPLPLEEQVSLELVKHNYTEEKLKEFEEYLKLDIVDDDKESYLIIKDKRKEVKSYRVAVEKFCKFKREDAVKIQKVWVSKENELVDKISKVEDYLESKEKAYEKKVAEEKEARKRKQEEQLVTRQQTLAAMGVLYSDGNFSIGEVSFELSLIKESEEDVWQEAILPKFKEEYEKVQAEQIERDRLKAEGEAEFKRQQEELEQKQKELAEKEADLKKEAERQAADAKAKEEAKNKTRISQLASLDLKPSVENDHLYYIGYDCAISHLDITGYDDDKWDKMIHEVTVNIKRKKEEEAEEKRKEQERKDLQTKRYAGLYPFREYGEPVEMDSLWSLSDEAYNDLLGEKTALHLKSEEDKAKKIADDAAKKERERIEEEQRQAEINRKNYLRESRLSALMPYDIHPTGIKDDLGDYTEDQWFELFHKVKGAYEEVLRKQEEEKKAEELAQATEKVKWAAIITQLNAIAIPAMRSSQYRKKAAILREKLEEIKAL